MADHIKYAVSCDVIDEYTTTNTASNDQSNDVADATISYSRHHPTIKKTLGGSVTANTTATGGIEHAGTVSLTTVEATVSGGTATTVNSSAAKDMIFLKNTGFNYDSGIGSTKRTTETVKVTVGTQVVCELHSGGAICLPKTPAAAVKVQSSDGSNNIAVECLLVT